MDNKNDKFGSVQNDLGIRREPSHLSQIFSPSIFPVQQINSEAQTKGDIHNNTEYNSCLDIVLKTSVLLYEFQSILTKFVQQ